MLPVGARPLRVLQISDVHLMPRQRRKVAWIKELARLRAGRGGQHRRQPLTRRRQSSRCWRRCRRSWTCPGRSCMGSNDYYAPKPRTPRDYLINRITPTGHPTTADRGADRRAARAGLAGPQQRPGAAGRRRVGAGAGRASTTRTSSYDRYDEVAGAADPAADLTVGILHAPYQRVLDAMTRDGAGLIIAGPHARRAAGAAGLRGARHQLRPRPAAGQGGVAVVAGRGGGAGRRGAR